MILCPIVHNGSPVAAEQSTLADGLLSEPFDFVNCSVSPVENAVPRRTAKPSEPGDRSRCRGGTRIRRGVIIGRCLCTSGERNVAGADACGVRKEHLRLPGRAAPASTRRRSTANGRRPRDLCRLQVGQCPSSITKERSRKVDPHADPRCPRTPWRPKPPLVRRKATGNGMVERSKERSKTTDEDAVEPRQSPPHDTARLGSAPLAIMLQTVPSPV